MNNYLYLNTYNNFTNTDKNSNYSFTLYSNRVNSDICCAFIANENQSNVFYLSDYNNIDASCYYLTNSSLSDASLANWISGSLQECRDTTCSNNNIIDNNVTTFGTGKNLSLYTTPSILIEIDKLQYYNPNKVENTLNNFSNNFTIFNNNIKSYISDQTNYLKFFYNHIIDVSNGIYIYDNSENQITGISNEKTALKASSILEENIITLNNLFNDKLNDLENLNNKLSIRYKLIEIINLKIFYAQNFFDILMNDNQGAIGELDISNYNKKLSLFQNIVITIVILYSIYLYFKKN